MKSNLPQGWYWGTVADIYDAVKTTINPTSSKSLSYIGLEHLSKGGGIDSISSSEELQSIKTVFQAGDVLYGKLRPYLNKHAVVDFAGVCSTDILVFRSKDKYPTRLLDFYLGSPSVVQYASEHSKGINLPRVNAGALLAMPMPIPPLEEASRIVAQLDALMQKLEASQERLDKLPDLLKKFRQAVLAAAVSGKLTEAWRAQQSQGETGADLLDRIRTERRGQWEDKQRAKLSGKQLNLNGSWKSKYEEPAAPDTSELPELPQGWTWCRLDNVAEMCLGKMLDNAKNQGTPQPYMGNINVRWGAFDLEDLKTMRFTPDENERYSIEKGDLVICEGGEPGRAAVWESESSIKIQKALHRVRPNHAFLTSYFLYYNLRLDAITHRLDSYFTGTGIQHFTGKALARYVIPIPPRSEQQEIIRQVNHYFSLADQLETRFEQAAALVEQLPQALLAKAFSGLLVPQDPDDEPASALLERLHAEPATPAKGMRGRKAKVAADAPLFE